MARLAQVYWDHSQVPQEMACILLCRAGDGFLISAFGPYIISIAHELSTHSLRWIPSERIARQWPVKQRHVRYQHQINWQVVSALFDHQFCNEYSNIMVYKPRLNRGSHNGVTRN